MRRARLLSTGFPVWSVYATAFTLPQAFLFWIFRLKHAHLSVPLEYWRGGDALFASALVKGLLENGWYLQNPRLGMPFGASFYDYPLPHILHFIAMRILGSFLHSYGLVLNIYFLLSFSLAAVTALWAL